MPLLKRVSLFMVALGLTSSLLAGADQDQKLFVNHAILRPIMLKDLPTSVSQLIEEFGKASKMDTIDISAVTSAALQSDMESVTAWIGSRSDSVITSQSEITKELVSAVLLERARPGKRPYVIVNNWFSSSLSALLGAVKNYPKSFSSMAETELTPGFVPIMSRSLLGTPLSPDETDGLKTWVKSKAGNIGRAGIALNIANLVLLDNIDDPGSFMDSVKDLPDLMQLSALIHAEKFELKAKSTDLFNKLLAEPNPKFDTIITLLTIAGKNPQTSLIADQILWERRTSLTTNQRVSLLTLLDDRSSPHLKEITQDLEIQIEALNSR